ncbi:hypothetical protein T09_421 [Trichinella sp. T9]|nr:hypothetical protein T09_421 [Trichinella sp. T9]
MDMSKPQIHPLIKNEKQMLSSHQLQRIAKLNLEVKIDSFQKLHSSGYIDFNNDHSRENAWVKELFCHAMGSP